MPQKTNLNVAPYYDDFTQDKNFYKVLFRPGYSIQARELTQLQSVLQNQIESFGKYAFKQGELVIPGEVGLNTKLPFVKLSKNELIQNDFKPFKECKPLFAMTAHVIYAAYDPINTATHSKIVIQDVIRKHMRFSGILISDDISMKALRYDFRENARRALNAGCNLIMHCNGNIKEMRELIKMTPLIDKFIQKKTSDFTKLII